MRMPWMIALWPGLALANETMFAIPGEEKGVKVWTDKACQLVEKFQGEVRGYQMVVDHDKRIITIRSYFYAQGNDKRAHKQLKAILRFWRKQNGRFVYQLGKGKSAKIYQIRFEVAKAPGTYLDNGFFLPDPGIDHQLISQIQIVADKDMPDGCDEETIVVGYSPENFIYIASTHADDHWVGIHEAGHRIGAGHHSGLMASNLGDRGNRLSKKSVREILAGGHIMDDHETLHTVSPRQFEQIGRPPKGFYHKGKVKRKHWVSK